MRLELKYLPILVKDALPTMFMDWDDTFFFTFWYEYDDLTSRIVSIDPNFEILEKITLRKYGNRPYTSIGKGMTLGFFKYPLNTQNSLLYQFLHYYASKSEKSKEALFELKFAFAEFKKNDLESINNKLKNTKYNNVFKVYDRRTFVEAISRYLYIDNEVKNNVEFIFDTLDYYVKKSIDISGLYGGLLERIVTAMRNPNGGLISETGNKLRYLYIGLRSEVMLNNTSSDEYKSYEKAKLMLRQKLTYDEIFTATGWYYNTFDNKWRLKISDKDCKIPNLKEGEMFLKANSLFSHRKNEIHSYITNKQDDEFPKIVEDGWDVMLGDVLQHPTLYKHYPQLYNVPIFFALSTSFEYNFYYSPSGNYLMMYGSPRLFDIRTVMLHETQHKIQAIENFGKGGDKNVVGKMIAAIGGEKVKEYFYLKSWNERIISLEAKPNGKYSFEKYQSYIGNLNVKGLPKYTNAKNYYDNIDEVCYSLEQLYMIDSLRSVIITFLDNNEIIDNFITVKQYMNSGRSGDEKMRQMGLNQQQIDDAKFNSYEYLLGEAESRDVQHGSLLDDEIGLYSLPYTSEALEEKKITVITKFEGDEDVPKDSYKGAVEKTNDNKYIIHLYESTTCEPLLHELGHIVLDLMGREYVCESIMRSVDSSVIDSFGGFEDVFCELFLCYIYKLNLSEEINYQIEERKLLDETFLDLDFKNIFESKTSESSGEKLGQMLIFATKLNKLIEESEIIEA